MRGSSCRTEVSGADVPFSLQVLSIKTGINRGGAAEGNKKLKKRLNRIMEAVETGIKKELTVANNLGTRLGKERRDNGGRSAELREGPTQNGPIAALVLSLYFSL
jgi:hypothetical protein